ncbi:hypothetical protein BHF68_01085 [Desulfuribacillus alkaliarsenatis]|uniref:Uncharacterized protein n=2 Tax=Desulfuribacillus alkaliarsenatis TaxID=766136 RepID=A0A1E5G6D3_9FIRM|nr:hypothetical protein BHF68_01085 [Desulfuribacillus alkaliarsenatis]
MVTSHPNKTGDANNIRQEPVDTWQTEMLNEFGNPVVFDENEETGIEGTRDIELQDGTSLQGVGGVYVVFDGLSGEDRVFVANFYNEAQELVHSMKVDVFHVGAGVRRQAFAVNLGDGYGTRMLKYQYSFVDWSHNYEWRDRNQARIFEVNCIACHVTGFDLPKWEADKNLTIAETTANLGVGCENCHGPGSNHAANPMGENLIVNPTVHLTVDQQIHNCSQCHIRGTTLDEHGETTPRQDNLNFRPGDNVLDFFRPMEVKFGEGTSRVATDGKARASRQQFMDHYIGTKSWMACTDCHSVHENNNEGKLLHGTVEELCASCHGGQYGSTEDIRELIDGMRGFEGNDRGWYQNHTYKFDDECRVIGFPETEWNEENKWPWQFEDWKWDWEQ